MLGSWAWPALKSVGRISLRLTSSSAETAIARALVHDPGCCFWMRPLAALDLKMHKGNAVRAQAYAAAKRHHVYLCDP